MSVLVACVGECVGGMIWCACWWRVWVCVLVACVAVRVCYLCVPGRCGRFPAGGVLRSVMCVGGGVLA